MSAVIQSPEGDSAKPPRKRRWLRWGIVVPLLLFGGGFTGLQLYRSSILAQVPDIGHPFSLETLFPPVSEEENSLTYFDRAYELVVEVPDDELKVFWDERHKGWTPDSHLLERHLDDNREALDLWLQGTERSEYRLSPELSVSAAHMTPVRDSRELFRLSDLYAEKHLRSDRPREATVWLRAMCRGSHLVRRDSTVLDRSVGIAFFAITAERIVEWSRHPDLTERDLREFLDILTEARSLQSPLSMSLKVDYDIAQREYQNWNYAEHEKAYRAIGAEPLFGGRLHVFMTCEPEFSRRALACLIANLLLFADCERRDRPVMIDGDLFDESGTGIVPPYGIPANQLWDVLAQSRLLQLKESSRLAAMLDANDRDEVMYRCLRVVLAAEAYYRRHGEFPADAHQLVPEFLDAVPDDPFSPTPASMIYRRQGEFAVVYSRFTNGVDDGGSTVTYGEANQLRRPPIPPDFGYRLVRELEPLLSAPRP